MVIAEQIIQSMPISRDVDFYDTDEGIFPDLFMDHTISFPFYVSLTEGWYLFFVM